MAKKLWHTTQKNNDSIEAYTSGGDIFWDQYLVSYDLVGSMAHARMLEQQGHITHAELNDIQLGLSKIKEKYDVGEFILNLGDEDVHTRVENELTEMFPIAGQKLHTGRSRNDQVLLDLRLFTKDHIIKTALHVIQLAQEFQKQAVAHDRQPLPGMTHMQPAMLSSFGLWLGSFCESLVDDLLLLETAFTLSDQSPLGSGAAYGVTIPLDRQLTAKLMGFAKVQNNALYCQNSRGKIDSFTLHAVVQVLGTLNKWASDCLLFTTEPFSFLHFEKSLGTGSSIMPQKNNWDALELMRASYHQVLAAQLHIQTTIANLPSGYNRDLQHVKKATIESFTTVIETLQVAMLFLQTLQPNPKQIAAHLPKELYAAHWAFVLVREKDMPFREAYRYVKDHLESIPHFDAPAVLALASTQGSPGNLQLDRCADLLAALKSSWDQKRAGYDEALRQTLHAKVHTGVL